MKKNLLKITSRMKIKRINFKIKPELKFKVNMATTNGKTSSLKRLEVNLKIK